MQFIVTLKYCPKPQSQRISLFALLKELNCVAKDSDYSGPVETERPDSSLWWLDDVWRLIQRQQHGIILSRERSHTEKEKLFEAQLTYKYSLRNSVNTVQTWQ